MTNYPDYDKRFFCNDPKAVNYNWNFPGQPDNTLCFYPTDVFKGSYMVHDSVYQDTLFLKADSFMMSVERLSDTQMTVSGFCSNGVNLRLSAGLSYIATIDTMVGDSVTFQGQIMCRQLDTVSGSIIKDKFDSSLLHIIFTVASDTGKATHYGSARKR